MAMKSVGLKVLILPLSLALVVMILIIFAKPAFQSMNANRKALAEGKKNLADLQLQTRKLGELKQNFESLEDRKIIAVALPENESPEDYLNELYQRASRSGVLVSSFSAASKNSSSSGQAAYACGAGGAASGTSSAEPSQGTAPGGANLAGSGSALAVSTPSCVQVASVEISAEGSWDQLLNFYKYLADSNRIANVTGTSIKSKGQTTGDGSSSDILESKITLNVYYRPKSQAGNPEILKTLAKGAGFDQGLIKKIKEVIYAQYEEPVVSETGERNFFK